MAGMRDGGRDAVGLLATTFVILLGVSVCAFIIVAFSNEPRRPALALGGTILGTLALIWMLRSKPRNQAREWTGFWFWRNKVNEKPEYEPMKRKIIEYDEYGTNKPPTVEDIREIKEGITTWVPSQPAKEDPSESTAD